MKIRSIRVLKSCAHAAKNDEGLAAKVYHQDYHQRVVQEIEPTSHPFFGLYCST